MRSSRTYRVFLQNVPCVHQSLLKASSTNAASPSETGTGRQAAQALGALRPRDNHSTRPGRRSGIVYLPDGGVLLEDVSVPADQAARSRRLAPDASQKEGGQGLLIPCLLDLPQHNRRRSEGADPQPLTSSERGGGKHLRRSTHP